MTEASARKYREVLKAGRWFSQLAPTVQDALVDAGVVRSPAVGEALFRRGDAVDGIFAVVQGAVRITATTEAGKEAMLTRMEAPTWFGEIAVFDRQPRTHDAIAEKDAVVVHVPLAALDAMLDADPKLWRAFGLLVAAKLRLAFLALEDSATSSLPARVARRLVWLAESHGEWHDRTSRVVDVKQDQLASMLSASRQTVNQVLKDLEARGLVKLAYGKIELLDLDGLRAVT